MKEQHQIFWQQLAGDSSGKGLFSLAGCPSLLLRVSPATALCLFLPSTSRQRVQYNSECSGPDETDFALLQEANYKNPLYGKEIKLFHQRHIGKHTCKIHTFNFMHFRWKRR